MKMFRWYGCLFMCVAGMYFSPTNEISAQTETMVFSFDRAQITMVKVSGYDVVGFEGCEFSRRAGAPTVPVRVVQIALPRGKTIAGVSVKNVRSETLDGRYDLYPAQPPQIFSDAKQRFTPPDPDIYDSLTPFPREMVQTSGGGSFSGQSMGALLLYPIQYFPAEKRLSFASEIEVEITYQEDGMERRSFKQTDYGESIRNETFKNMIRSSATFEPSVRKSGAFSHSTGEEHLYVIITSDELTPYFQPLADWKRKKGLSAVIVKTTTIVTSYSGRDLQEKIRNFIIEAHKTWGTIWVLLGGDTNVIPDRKAYAFDCEYGNDFSVNYIPCDLYYSDLDGDWDANGNGTFGEVEDDVDMYADVFVGRAPVENAGEAAAFVNKVLTYEKTSNGHELELLFLADVLWQDPYTNSGDGKDMIDRLYVPDRFDPITKLYDALGNQNPVSVKNALNAGQNLVNHDGHAWTSVMAVGTGSLTISDMDALVNGPKYSILFSIGCWPAAIDYDCIAEHFVTNPNGGGVAFIGNSRYGWGSPGNAEYGYSDRFDQQFYKSLFIDHNTHIGSALAAAKSFYVPHSAQENVYRWCEYEVNLLGDPEMPVWTDAPGILVVRFPDSLVTGETVCPIAVTDGNRPVEGALVCLMQEDGVYETGITGKDGTVRFAFLASNPANDLQLTVTAQNFLPFEGTIPLTTDAPYVQVSYYSTDGSAESFIRPDFQVFMDCSFKNFGNRPAIGVEAVLTNGNGIVVLADSTESLGNIQPGDSVVVQRAFLFQTAEGLKNGDGISLDVDFTDSAGNHWRDRVGATVVTPVISNEYYLISDSQGDGDGFGERGETVSIQLAMKNDGLVYGRNVNVNLSSSDPVLSLMDTSLDFGDIPRDSTKCANFNLKIDNACPEPSFPVVVMQIAADGGYASTDSFRVSVGEFGIQDDMENGTDNWTHTGSPDLWHLTSNRKHSGNFSWYCGNGETFVYDNGMDNVLESSAFVVDDASVLSFWCWYECPNYGVNGFNPEIDDGSGWKKLDFIGSGGALGALPTGNDWLEYTYDLSEYPAGTSLRLRFRFVSDNENVTEGVYIDDVVIQNEHRRVEFGAPPILPVPVLICTEEDNTIRLSWENDYGSIENYQKKGYTFQGYNVYQMVSTTPLMSNAVRVATFDVVDGVKEIVENIVDPQTGIQTPVTQQFGSDSGILRRFVVDRNYIEDDHLVKGKPYFFAVTAYAYNPNPAGLPKCSESLINVVEVVFQKGLPGYAWGDTIRVTHQAGKGDGTVLPIIVDPSLLTGDNYRVDFGAIPGGMLGWNLTDLTMSSVLLNQQPVSNGNVFSPVVDGFRMMVEDANQVDFSDLAVDGQGNYTITSYYKQEWAQTALAVDTYGRGSVDVLELEKDYELRFTGEYANPSADIVHVKPGTGSMATISGARLYELKDHPMNPMPGSNAPFAIRIPFEVWNSDDNRQVNLLVYDRSQYISNRPFYAFNPSDRMYCWIMNTPYSGTVTEFRSDDLDHLTWNLVVWWMDFRKGDVIMLTYPNAFKSDDVYYFSTDTSSNGLSFPQEYELYQNYPNPFNVSTRIRFGLPVPSFVVLKVFNLLGREIETLTEARWEAGRHEIVWDAKDLPSGLYLYRLEAGGFRKTKKVVLVK
ncbi:MAG: C25 family cysteine peptidase [bacterium]